jgi:cadmium resistance protein CadD (predicted permease)
VAAEIWQDAIAGLVLGVVAYASTNLDNVLLVSSAAASGSRRGDVVRGWIIAATAVFGLSIALSAVAGAIPPRTLGWLGLLPLLLGIRLLAGGGNETDEGATAAAGTMPVAMLLLSNSSDTIATFGPLLAESEPVAQLAMLAGFVAAAAALIVLLMKLAAHLDPASRLARIAAKLSPLVMIAIGIYILLDTTTDTV